MQVNPYGPLDSRVVWIGEAPGRTEVRLGRPFVGKSGDEARRALRMYGIDDESVLWANCVNINPGTFPTGRQGAMLMQEWAPQLDALLAKTSPEIIVACGGQALHRLTGFTGINDWTGSMIKPSMLQDNVKLYEATKTRPAIKIPLTIPSSVKYIVPLLHPAGILRTKGREDLPIFYRGVEKVSLALSGKLKQYTLLPNLTPKVEVLEKALSGASMVYFDTEFNPETGELYQFGLTFDGTHIFSFDWKPKYFNFVREIMEDETLLKSAHNIRADWEILERNGIFLRGKTYCTMIGSYVLHPEFNVGLSPTSRFYLDDVIHTKWMDKTDPIYNCFDVLYGWHSKVAQEEELEFRRKQIGVDQSVAMNSRQELVEVAMRMEQDGILLDMDTRAQLIKDQEDFIAQKEGEVQTAISPFWLKRSVKAVSEFNSANERYEGMRLAYAGNCKKHPTFYPSKKPPQCDICQTLHSSQAGEAFREKYATLKKVRDEARKEVKKLEAGFNFNSSDDLAWLLYSPNALQMPVRRAKGSKKPTTNADAIERLSQSVIAKRKAGFGVVLTIKEMQQASKAKSTFLEIPFDDKFYVHPPYKVHGTKTGRLAGGEDTRGELDKVSKKYAFNILNIPKDWRKIYVAPPGKIILAADWKNQEGRLMAFFSKDKAYLEAFREEDSGGHEVHCITANIIYGIDPSDAKTTNTRFGGNVYDMRHCAKVANHAVSYSPTPEYTLMKNFQMSREDAIRIVDALNEARPSIPRYKVDLIRSVLGYWEPFEGYDGKMYTKLIEPGSLWDATPFGWVLYFFGGASAKRDPRTDAFIALPDQAGEVVAFRQQTSGSHQWSVCATELRKTLGVPLTGTYDSFYYLVDDEPTARQKAEGEVRRVLERPWPELGNMIFPIDIEWGYNLGPYDKKNPTKNPRGLAKRF